MTFCDVIDCHSIIKVSLACKKLEEEAVRDFSGVVWRHRKQNGGLTGNSGGAETELREL